MTEAIVAVIVALGGTAGIVKIIQAIKGTSSDMIEELEKVKGQLVQSKETDLAILRNTITHLYYKYLPDKAMPYYERENLISLYQQYAYLDGNSYIHDIYEEMLKWEVI